MASELTQRIEKNAQYQHLIKTRNALGWRLTLVVFAAYYGFILVVAFDKQLFATPLAAGMTTTWGIPLGIGIILLTVLLDNKIHTEDDIAKYLDLAVVGVIPEYQRGKKK